MQLAPTQIQRLPLLLNIWPRTNEIFHWVVGGRAWSKHKISLSHLWCCIPPTHQSINHPKLWESEIVCNISRTIAIDINFLPSPWDRYPQFSSSFQLENPQHRKAHSTAMLLAFNNGTSGTPIAKLGKELALQKHIGQNACLQSTTIKESKARRSRL